MAEFKIGDTVKLKSGGPLMTVDSAPDSQYLYIDCVWFDDVTVKKETFAPEALEGGGKDKT